MGLLSATTGTVQFIFDTNTVIQLDCSVHERHSRASPPTEFELEDGQTITDHIIVKPFMLKIQGIITDTPLSALLGLVTTAASRLLPSPAVLGPAAGALALAPAISGAIGDLLGGVSKPSVAAYEQLLQIQASKLPVSVKTSLKLYNNMWIADISVPRDSKTGQTLIFDIDLVQLLLVSPQTTNISQYVTPDVSAGQANLGTKAGSDQNSSFSQGFGAGKSLPDAVGALFKP